MAFNLTGGQLYELRHAHRMDGQLMLNIYNFIMLNDDGTDYSGAEDAAEVAATFSSLWGNLMYASLSSRFRLVRTDILRVIAIRADPNNVDPQRYNIQYGEEVRYEPESPAGGAEPGETLPTYVAATIRMGGLTRIGNRRTFGSKRIGGLLESITGEPVSGNGNYITDPMFTVLSNLGTFFERAQNVAPNAFLRIGVVNKAIAALTGDQPQPDPIEGFAPCTSAEANRYVGSQVSRKQGNRAL